MDTNTFWAKFLSDTGRDPDTAYIECFHFELTERLANELLDLVLRGIKRATCSSRAQYALSGDRMPQIGDLSVVTDWAGEPRCVIETTAVTVLPFSAVTYEIAAREGEDDTLESWRAGHRRFFEADGRDLGYAFSEDMDVVFEDFRVIYRS